MNNQKILSVLSYNAIGVYDDGICHIDGYDVLFLPHSFNPKSPESVSVCDPNWQQLLLHREHINYFIVFAGKKTSGSLEIINLVCTEFQTEKQKVLFILCDHDLEEKIQTIHAQNYGKNNYMCFSDNVLPCQETPLLLGYLWNHIHNNKIHINNTKILLQ